MSDAFTWSKEFFTCGNPTLVRKCVCKAARVFVIVVVMEFVVEKEVVCVCWCWFVKMLLWQFRMMVGGNIRVTASCDGGC